MIKTLKTLAIAMLAAGATAPSIQAAVTIQSTNLFQPLTVALKVYQQKAITDTSATIQTGAAASFNTANLTAAVTTTLVTNAAGTAFGKTAAVGFVTIGTNSVLESNTNAPILVTNTVNVPETVDLSSKLVPLTIVTNYTTTSNVVYQITNIYDTNGSITNSDPADTNTYFVTNGSGTNSLTNALAFGVGESNTITITVTNGTTNVTVVTPTSTNTYTNLSDISLSGTNATVGTNEYGVGVGGSLENSSSTNSVFVFSGHLVIETNGGTNVSLFIGTNSFSISTNVVSGTNVDVIVSLGQAAYVISTNSVGDTNGTTNVTTIVEIDNGTNAVSTNTYSTTNALTNLVFIGDYVIVSNGVTSGFGTNQTLTDSLTTGVTVTETSTNTVTTSEVTNSVTNVVLGVTNVVINVTETLTSNAIVTDDAVLTPSVVAYTTTNVLGTNGYGSSYFPAPSGPAQLVVKEQTGTGANLTYIYTPIPPTLLSISNTPSTNNLIVATYKSTSTNEQNYSIKTLTLSATNVSFTLQGLVHSTLAYVSLPDATLTGKKTAVTNEAWADISGYGTNGVAPIVLSGAATVGAPAQEKQP
jgi:hypothetical protein